MSLAEREAVRTRIRWAGGEFGLGSVADLVLRRAVEVGLAVLGERAVPVGRDALACVAAQVRAADDPVAAARDALCRIVDAQDRGLLEIRLGRGAERGRNQEVEQALLGDDIGVATHRLSAEHGADEVVVGLAAGRTAVAQATIYRLRIKRHA